MKKISFILTVVLVAFFAVSCDDQSEVHSSGSKGYYGPIGKVEIKMVQVAPAKGDTFYIGKYEVTQKEWRAVMGTKPAYNLGGDNYPIENVSYEEVQEFLNKLNEKTNAGYRLPTVEEWETAAYAANRQLHTYAGTSETEKLGDYAWWKNNSQDVHNEPQTHEVGQKLPNALGIYDMSGNVSEMTSDISADENKIITKGGTCRSVAAQCAIAAKDSFPMIGNVRGIRCGFRLVRDK